MTIQPRRRYRCTVCGGLAHRRVNIAHRHDEEDTDMPLLHLHDEDWKDNPHDVIPEEKE